MSETPKLLTLEDLDKAFASMVEESRHPWPIIYPQWLYEKIVDASSDGA